MWPSLIVGGFAPKDAEHILMSELFADHADALDDANHGQHLHRAHDCLAVRDEKSHRQVATQTYHQIAQAFDHRLHIQELEAEDDQETSVQTTTNLSKALNPPANLFSEDDDSEGGHPTQYGQDEDLVHR